MNHTIETFETHEERRDKGFTLIELLIVIVILGILATVTVFAVGGITDRGQDNACSTDLRTMETAVEAFRANSPTGALPATEADLVPGFLSSTSDMHDYALDGSAAAGYTITAVGSCA